MTMFKKFRKNQVMNNPFDDHLESPINITHDDDNDGSLYVTTTADESLPTVTDHDKSSTIKFSNGNKIVALPPGYLPAHRAIFLIANGALGAGLLNFPQAYKNAGGIKVAMSLQNGMLLFIVGAFLILARCADYSQAATYQDIILCMLGRRAKNVNLVMIGIYFFGSAITYILIIGEELSSILVLATGGSSWYTDKRFLFTVFSLLFLLPLSLPRRLDALSYTSFFGGVGAFFISFVIVYRYYEGSKPPIVDVEYKTDWKSVFTSLPVICFGFQCHVSAVPVYADLKDRSLSKFFYCSLVAMFVCSVTYCLSGSFGYMSFGAGTKPDILENYYNDDVLATVARLAIVFVLLSSFAIVTFCARTVIDGVVISFRKMKPDEAERTERRRRYIETICWFAACLFIASVVPDIGVAIGLIGGIASTFIFVFPGLLLLQTVDLNKPESFTLKEILIIFVSALYIVVGTFIFGLVTTLGIQSDIKPRQLQ